MPTEFPAGDLFRLDGRTILCESRFRFLRKTPPDKYLKALAEQAVLACH